MCTVTWFHTAAGYELFFNRDELDGRAPEEPVSVQDHPDGAYLAPRDPEGGGTWLAVSADGWTLALLNGDEREMDAPEGGWLSRGRIIPDLIHAPRQSLHELELKRFRPFTLLKLGPNAELGATAWDGRSSSARNVRPKHGPLTSSGVDPQATDAGRRQLLDAALETSGMKRETFLAFHRIPGDGAELGHGPCVRREGIHTRSLCHVVVDAMDVSMAHAAGPPDRTPLGPPVRLARTPRLP